MDRARRRMEDNLAAPLNLGGLAKATNLSPFLLMLNQHERARTAPSL